MKNEAFCYVFYGFNQYGILILNTNALENAIFRNMQMKASLPTIHYTLPIGIVKQETNFYNKLFHMYGFFH